MDYKTAIEFFDTLDDDAKAKEIYAHFGLAVFFAQVLEQQAINMIAVCRQVKNVITAAEQVDTLWDDYNLGSRTLGVLINEIKQLYYLSDEDFKELNEVLKLRNYIAHDYFRFNTELFYSDSGMKRMIKDFVEFRERAQSLDRKLHQYMKIYSDNFGVTDKQVEIIIEQTKKEWEKKTIMDNHKTIMK